MHQSSQNLRDDGEFLHWLFDRVLEDIEDGRTANIDALVVGREHLRPEADELVRRAQQVAFGRARPLPKIPGYTILGELGHGGMGAVYLARQEALAGRLVAIKMLPPMFAMSPRARERFAGEAKAIAKLRHPNVVDVYDVIQDFGLYAFAMEWVDGASLAGVIEHLRNHSEKTASIEDVRTFLGGSRTTIPDRSYSAFICRSTIAVARALAAVHQAGMLHRDVKPSNILIRRDGAPMLSDFGLAREVHSAAFTQSGLFVGTPAYAAPEQLRGETQRLDARTDVYSLGATLFHALALKLPFEARDPAVMISQIEAGAPPLRKVNPRLPRDLETIVARTMDPDPARRYESADAMADDLERFIQFRPILARPAGLITRAIKLARRKRGVVWGGLVASALTLAVASAAVVYWFLVPGWVKQHVDEARLALIDPRQNNLFWNVVFIGTDDSGTFESPMGMLRQALESYEKAARWRPLDNEILLERETVRMILRMTDSWANAQSDKTVEVPVAIAEQAPLTSAIVNEWMQMRHVPSITDQKLQAASPNDLRCLGLTAFLCGNVQTTLAAWSRLDLESEPDAFVQGALGQLYLVLDQPARAYPRLQIAAAAYPDVGFLAICLADAAVQCGDLEKAQRILEEARTLPHGDPMGGWSRVKADLDAAAGRDRLAREEYHRLLGFNPIAVYHYSRYLEARSETLLALRTCQGSSQGTKRHFANLFERYWKSLSVRQRWRVLRRILDERVPTPLGGTYGRDYGSFWVMFEGYYHARRNEADRKEQLPPDGTRRQLRVICDNIAGWGLDRHHPLQHVYPSVLKDLQAAAWLCPLPRVATWLVTGVYRFYAVCRRAGTSLAAPPSPRRTEFIPVGDLPGGDFASAVTDVSADGSTVVGFSRSALGIEALRWKNGQLDGLGIPKGDFTGSAAQAVSADGTTVVGYAVTPRGHLRPIRWENGAGMELPLPFSDAQASARDVSGDGRTIVGEGFALGSVVWRHADNGGEPRVTHVTQLELMSVISDGSMAAGSVSGEFKNAATWREGIGMTRLPHPPGERLFSRIFAASADGSVLAGTSLRPATAEYGQLHEACLWVIHHANSPNERATVDPLGDLPGGSDDSLACGVSGDGRVIVGWGFGPGGCREACIWDGAGLWVPAARDGSTLRCDRERAVPTPRTPGVPMPVNLRDLLQDEYNLDLSGWVLTEARAISADGRTIAGNGLNPDGHEEGWTVRLSDPAN